MLNILKKPNNGLPSLGNKILYDPYAIEGKSENDYYEKLCRRLRELDIPFKNTSTLCLATGDGAECQAFNQMGSLAVHLDLKDSQPYTIVTDPETLNIRFAFANATFDFVYLNLLTCKPELEKLLPQIMRVLKPDGHVIFWHEDDTDLSPLMATDFEPVKSLALNFFGLKGTQSIYHLIAKRYKSQLLIEADPVFNELYHQGSQLTDMMDNNPKRIRRFYNLINLLNLTRDVHGEIAECGCWKGLSSYLMNHYLRRENAQHSGQGYHIFDSFEGLSEPTEADKVVSAIDAERVGKPYKAAGAYTAEMDAVRTRLGDFPDIGYNKGWLPESLDGLPERVYRFVHIDVDLYAPTLGAAEYFYPRLAPGGMIVCDDYGSLFFPGAKQALDEFGEKFNVPIAPLSTGQCVILKR